MTYDIQPHLFWPHLACVPLHIPSTQVVPGAQTDVGGVPRISASGQGSPLAIKHWITICVKMYSLLTYDIQTYVATAAKSSIGFEDLIHFAIRFLNICTSNCGTNIFRTNNGVDSVDSRRDSEEKKYQLHLETN